MPASLWETHGWQLGYRRGLGRGKIQFSSCDPGNSGGIPSCSSWLELHCVSTAAPHPEEFWLRHCALSLCGRTSSPADPGRKPEIFPQRRASGGGIGRGLGLSWRSWRLGERLYCCGRPWLSRIRKSSRQGAKQRQANPEPSASLRLCGRNLRPGVFKGGETRDFCRRDAEAQRGSRSLGFLLAFLAAWREAGSGDRVGLFCGRVLGGRPRPVHVRRPAKMAQIDLHV